MTIETDTNSVTGPHNTRNFNDFPMTFAEEQADMARFMLDLAQRPTTVASSVDYLRREASAFQEVAARHYQTQRQNAGIEPRPTTGHDMTDEEWNAMFA